MSDTYTDEQGGDESAQWAELAKELGEEPAAGVEPTQGEGGADPGAEAAPADEEGQQQDGTGEGEGEQKQAIPYEEMDRRLRQTSGALKQEREEKRQLREQYNQFLDTIKELRGSRQQGAQGDQVGQQADQGQTQQQAQQQQPPSLEEDPIGYIQHMEQTFKSQLAERDKVIDELKGNHEKTSEQFQQDQQARQLMNVVQRSEQEIVEQAPDYPQACEHLEQGRRGELQAMYPDESQLAHALARQEGFNSPSELRDAIINQERIAIAQHAVKVGASPAQLYYDLAKQRGYSPQQANGNGAANGANGAAEQASQAIEAARRGTKASNTLSGGGGGKANDDMSLADLADLYQDNPEEADKVFDKMAQQGLLG